MKKSGSVKTRLMPLWVLGLLGIATIGLFANSWSNPFILDDLVKVVNNGDIRNIDRIGDTLVYPYGPTPTRNRNDPSRPVVYLIYTAIYHFWSINTVPYHVVNTVIHFGNGVLVYLLIQFFSQSIYTSLLMALLFILLPIQAGVSIYVYSLSDLLVSFFVLLAFYFFVRGKSSTEISTEAQPRSKVKSVLKSSWVVIFYVLALGSKQTGIVLPIILVLYQVSFCSFKSFQKLGEGTFRLLLPIFPVAAVTLIYLISRYWYFGGIGDLEGFQQVQDRMSYMGVQGWVILKYIQLTFVPIGLTIDHGVMQYEYSNPVLLLCWSIVLGVGLFGFKLVIGSSFAKKVIGFGLLFYLAVVLPTSILPTVDCLVERRVYLANFGLLFALSGLFIKEYKLRAVDWKKFLGVCLILVYFAVSFNRNETFASERQIWEESLSSYPGYSRALINSAWISVMEKRYEQGEKTLKLVLNAMPQNTEVLAKLGTLYSIDDFSGKNIETALSYFQQAIAVNSDYFIGRYLAAEVLVKLNRFEEAKDMLKKAIETNKTYSPAYLLLGKIAESQNDPLLAESYFKFVRQIDPQGKPY
jgi:hypothetical protein